MTKRIIALLGTVAVAAVAGGAVFMITMKPEPAQAAQPDWLTDMQKAQEIAAKEKKDLLINFTGSDWCAWCIRLRKEVFNEKGFEKALDDYVLVEMDFPNDESLISAETKAQNEKWSNRFGIQGFPTVVLTDAKGRPYGSTGYVEGGPKTFLGELEQQQKARETRDERLAKAEKAEGVEKAKLLASALEVIPSEYHLPAYEAEVEQIIKLDAENKAGLKEQFVASLQRHEAQQKLQTLQEELQVAYTKEGAAAALKIVQDELKAKQAKENPVLKENLQQFELQLLIKTAEELAAADKVKEAEETFKAALDKTKKGANEWLVVQANRAAILQKADKSKEAAGVYDEMLTAEGLVDGQKAMLLVFAAEAYGAAKQEKEKADRIAKADKLLKELKDSEELPPQFMEQITERLESVRKGDSSEEKENSPAESKETKKDNAKNE